MVYHGSELRFTEFKNRNPNIKGYFFSNEINTSRTYGEKTYEVFLNIKSPFSVDAKGGNFQTDLDIEVAVKYPNEEEYKTTVKENSDNIVRLAMGIDKNSFWKLDGSFDGCIFYNFKDQSLSSQRNEIQNTYVAFKPNQIKLADGTNLTFDPNNDDIRFENGGLTEIEQWKLEQAQNDQQAFNLLQNYFGFELPENADTYEYKKGGNLDKDIECHKCGWEWDKKDSEKFDMYVCHKCGFDNSDFYKRGGRTVAQTPAPSSERIYGSKRNKPSSSKDSSSAESIKFDQKTLTSIENKVEKHNAEHRDKRISLSIAKAIVRRGMGAYSKSHRPTIKGGKPNSRVAWGLARLNAFIYKVVHGVSKSGKYSQDNDLLDELGIAHEKFKTGGKISKKNKHGDCYVVAGRIALNNRLPKGENREFVGEPYVIHAQVIGQGAIEGLKYGHAWVEDDVYVYDYSNGRELKIPKVVYYKLGQVIEQQPIYFKYTFGEAKRKMAETGHFGSWDLITESGL